MTQGAEWPAWLHLDGWSGRTKQPITVVAETRKRYRVRSANGSAVRLGGRCRYIEGDETALVPKYAVTARDEDGGE